MNKRFFKIHDVVRPLIMFVVLGVCQVTLATEIENVIFQHQLPDYTSNGYGYSVDKLLLNYERFSGVSLVPGEKGKVALKVYSESQAGLSTPLPLVRSLIKALEERGFKRSNIIIVGERTKYLREAGFIPPISVGGFSFDRCPVYALDRNKYYDPEWFYENPLPSRMATYRGYPLPDDRKSFLSMTLCHDVDFWINLPMITSHPNTGVTGAVANASILNVSNNRRFFDNPLHASLAMAEIFAIPELQDSYAFTILSLERYQCIGGSKFHSLYTASEPLLLLSKNAPALDHVMLHRINKLRSRHHFPLIEGLPSFFEYCKQLKVGDYDAAKSYKVK